MPLVRVQGDPLLTRAQYLAFGYNAAGRIEMPPLQTALHQRYGTAFARYRRRCQQGKMTAGTVWTWVDANPKLMFLVIRASSVGATRLRYVQSALLMLARDYALFGVKSVALARLGTDIEWPEIQSVIADVLGRVRFPVYVYETYQPGLQANEDI